MDELKDNTFDLLVVGGGIVGAGVARDAAMRGLRTALVDQHDFASGTSSRSTRLLHGGIRYLAQGRVGLVREASKEKKVVHRIAPHLSDPLAFVFPTYKSVGLPRWKMYLGVKLYDLLCGHGNLGRSSRLSPQETLGLLPNLEKNGLTGAVRYFDGLTNDARLVLDTLRSASNHRAVLCNYVRFTKSTWVDKHWQCDLVDARTGSEFRVRSQTLVNATGPWSDRIPRSKTSLRLTKGVHLVIDRVRLPVEDAVVMVEGERILFAIPWGQRVFLGTTDTDYNGPLDDPRCEEEDANYVLDSANQAFPSAKLTTDDVISTWAGLRPLVADPHGNPSDISRRHEISMSSPGWWDVTGGKLTTYRLMAEETVNAVAGYLGADVSSCRTADVPLLEPQDVGIQSGIIPPEISPEVVQHYCHSEWARHLDDVMIRRTSWRHYHHDHFDIASRVAKWMGTELGWKQLEIDEELGRYRLQTSNGDVAAPHFAVEKRMTTQAPSA